MDSARIPSAENKELTEHRLQVHAEKHYLGMKGVTEIRTRFKDSYLFLEAVKDRKPGFREIFLKKETVREVSRLARLEFLGPNKWKFLIYNPEIQKYNTYGDLQEGTIEECLDAAARVFLTG